MLQMRIAANAKCQRVLVLVLVIIMVVISIVDSNQKQRL